jgi:ubiquinol-cytochrome c reductase cytochrome c subunit
MLRRLLNNRSLLPTLVLLTVGLGSVLGLATSAGAQGKNAAASATVSATGGLGSAHTTSTARKLIDNAASCKKEIDAISYTGPANSGSPQTSTKVTCVDGRLTSYGSSAITYKALPESYIKAGEALFEQNCSSCHEADAQGGTAAPSLIGVGPATVDFWVSTGRMPAATPLSAQAQPKPPKLTNREAEEVAAFITFLSPAAPWIPTVHLKGANLATGANLFALNCAACHTITGMGDELAFGTDAPSLHHATPTQVAEAIRTGPGNMPRFTGNLSDSQVRDIVAYVTERIQHPANPGGFGLGGVGPVAEGFVGLLFGVGGLMLVCFWIGDRS